MLTTLLVAVAVSSMSQDAYPLRVMTYNVRYSAAKDGENSWSKRKGALIERIRENAPDLLGVQEALKDQVDAIAEAFPEYGLYGLGRDNGREAGEFSAVFYRKTYPTTPLLNLISRQQGTRWISDAPLKPGSIGPEANLPRIFTWLVLTHGSAGPSVLVINTHFDHQSAAARLLGARQIAEFIGTFPKDYKVIVMGDFNCSAEAEPVRALLATAKLRRLEPTVGPFGTFSGFKLGATSGDMIDHIFVSQGVEAKRVTIDRSTYESGGAKRYPSDHFPVVADLVYP